MKKIIIVFSLLFVFIIPSNGQEAVKQKNYIEIPSSYGAVFIMVQPDAPFKFEEVQLLTDEEGKIPYLRYLIKNISEKQVVSFEVEFHHKSKISQWGKYGNGWVEKIGKKENGGIVVPLNGTYENINREGMKLVPINRTIINNFTSKEKNAEIKTIWLGFIKKAVFADGSEFNANTSGDALEELLLDEIN